MCLFNYKQNKFLNKVRTDFSISCNLLHHIHKLSNYTNHNFSITIFPKIFLAVIIKNLVTCADTTIIFDMLKNSLLDKLSNQGIRYSCCFFKFSCKTCIGSTMSYKRENQTGK